MGDVGKQKNKQTKTIKLLSPESKFKKIRVFIWKVFSGSLRESMYYFLKYWKAYKTAQEDKNKRCHQSSHCVIVL